MGKLHQPPARWRWTFPGERAHCARVRPARATLGSLVSVVVRRLWCLVGVIHRSRDDRPIPAALPLKNGHNLVRMEKSSASSAEEDESRDLTSTTDQQYKFSTKERLKPKARGRELKKKRPTERKRQETHRRV